MRTAWMRSASTCLLVSVLTGCSIQQTIEPAPAREVAELCIKENERVLMDGFLPELRQQIERRGFATRIYRQPARPGCPHTLDYTANWKWDLAMYLEYAELRLYEDARLIGSAEYDARMGGGRLDKFGSTAEKLAPLVDGLLANVTPAPSSAATPPDPVERNAQADGPPGSASESVDDVAHALERLKELREDGAITEQEYANKRKELLDRI